MECSSPREWPVMVDKVLQTADAQPLCLLIWAAAGKTVEGGVAREASAILRPRPESGFTTVCVAGFASPQRHNIAPANKLMDFGL